MAKATTVVESSRLASEPFLTEERVLNLYAVPGPDGARSRILFRSTLGYGAPFSNLGVLVLRTLAEVNGTLYAVGSGNLYEIDSAGTATVRGTVADGALTTISGNGTNVTIAAGNTYYVWDGATLTSPGSGRISSIGTVGYIDGYTVLSQNAGDEIEWTTLNDAKTRNALFFASAENENDNLIRIQTVGSNLWAIGERSIELFYNTGLSGADAFSRVSGGVIKRGCLGALLSVVFDPGDGSGHNLFWIGDDKRPYRANNVSPAPLPRAEGCVAAIEAETPTHCFFYEDQGHKYFVVRFANRPAWCFDTATGLWHERGTDVTHGAWEVVATARVGTTWYAATSTGKIYALARVNKDDTKAMRRTLVFRPIEFAGAQFSVPNLEIVAQSGAANLGRDAQIMLRLQQDNQPWSSEMTESLGAYGEYWQRAEWGPLGSQRIVTYEISISDPADIAMVSDANIGIDADMKAA